MLDRDSCLHHSQVTSLRESIVQDSPGFTAFRLGKDIVEISVDHALYPVIFTKDARFHVIDIREGGFFFVFNPEHHCFHPTFGQGCKVSSKAGVTCDLELKAINGDIHVIIETLDRS